MRAIEEAKRASRAIANQQDNVGQQQHSLNVVADASVVATDDRDSETSNERSNADTGTDTVTSDDESASLSAGAIDELAATQQLAARLGVPPVHAVSGPKKKRKKETEIN